MELTLSFSQLAYLFILLYFSLSLFSLVRKHRRPKLPPGPWKLPLIGNLHQLLGSRMAAPHQTFSDLARKHGPLMHLKLGEISTLVVSSRRIAKEVLTTHDLCFADRPEFLAAKILFNNKDIAFAPYGDYWRQIRRICLVELLSSKTVRSFHAIREQEVESLVASIRSSCGSPINITKKLQLLLNSIISRSAFGKPPKDQDRLIKLIREATCLVGSFDVADLFPTMKFLHGFSRLRPRIRKVHHEVGNTIGNIIKERRQSELSEENVLDVLLKHQEINAFQFAITDDSIKAIILDLFIAGTDASSVIIDWALFEMLKSPKVMEKAMAEVRLALKGKEIVQEADIQGLSYLKLVIKETLRLHPPLPMLAPRVGREACEIDGYAIPIKTHVFVNAWAIGRDPEYWNDAENFIPERFENNLVDFTGTNYEYIPFGAGRRICPGMSFGIATIELALAQLLYHFDWTLPAGMKPEELDMTETGGNFARRSDLFVVAMPCGLSATP